MVQYFLIDENKLSDEIHNGVRPVTPFISSKILEIVFDKGKTRVFLSQFVKQLVGLFDSSNFCQHIINVIRDDMRNKLGHFIIANGEEDTVFLLQQTIVILFDISLDQSKCVIPLLKSINQALDEIHLFRDKKETRSMSSKAKALFTSTIDIIFENYTYLNIMIFINVLAVFCLWSYLQQHTRKVSNSTSDGDMTFSDVVTTVLYFYLNSCCYAEWKVKISVIRYSF